MTSVTTDRRLGVNASQAVKVPCHCATTANITLSGTQTIDAVAVTDERVLVKDQDDAAENGIYDVASGAWNRAPDFDGSNDVVQGTLIVIANGTTNGNTIWRITTANDITIGTTEIAFALSTNELNGVSAFMQTMLDDLTSGAALTTLDITAYAQTILDDANSAAALATLVAAGTAIANTFTKTQSWKKGADVASATTLVLGTDGNYFDITGTTAIEGITVAAGTLFMLQFDGALTFTDGASLDLAGANITTATGGRALLFATAANTVQLLSYMREGTGPLTFATQAEQETGTSLIKAVSPGTQHSHLSAAKVLGYVDRSAGTPSLSSPSYNITAVVDDGNANTTVTIAEDFSTAVYVPGANSSLAISTGSTARCHSLAAGAFDVYVVDVAGSALDTVDFQCWAFGDQA